MWLGMYISYFQKYWHGKELSSFLSKYFSAGDVACLIYLPSNKNLEFLEQRVFMQLNNQKWSGSLEEVRPVSHAELPVGLRYTMCVRASLRALSAPHPLGVIFEPQFQLCEGGHCSVTVLQPGTGLGTRLVLRFCWVQGFIILEC